MEISKSLYNDIEKLGTPLKFELFCILNNKKFDRDNFLYAKIKDVVRCRNEFVHPKPKDVDYQINENDDIELLVTKTKTGNYPLYISLFEPGNVKLALSDMLSFLAWIVFDICGYNLKDGSFLIRNKVVSTSADIY